ncbi:hypothetical protein JN085_07890 [Mycolicibacterium austroafricanum]|nr:hypothetical protein JN085_07890 [Mycolicibacterium austroafricanum]
MKSAKCTSTTWWAAGAPESRNAMERPRPTMICSRDDWLVHGGSLPDRVRAALASIEVV